MLRLILLLITFGTLAIFVFQNVSPVLPLVILGMQTPAFPVGLWVVGAIAAGALTTFVIAVLIRLAAPPRRPRTGRTSPTFQEVSPTQPPDNSSSGPSSSAWTPPAWAAGRPRPEPEPVDAPRRTASRSSGGRASRGGDWEQPPPADEWDDWVETSETSGRSPSPQGSSTRRSADRRPADSEYRATATRYEDPLEAPYVPPIYDAEVLNATPPEATADEAYAADARRYATWTETAVDEPVAAEAPPISEPEKEIWDDWEEEPVKPSPPTEEPPETPNRDFVEVRRDPQTRYQSGTIYSYSYRREQNTDNTRRPDPPAPAAPPSSPPPSPTAASSPRVIIPPAPTTPAKPATETFDNPFAEISEDEAWENWNEEDAPAPPARPPEEPYRNPPLNLGERWRGKGEA